MEELELNETEAEENDNPTNHLSFIDSWKSNSFELGAAAAITGGAMYLGLTGRAPDLKRGAMNAGRNAANAVNRYLNTVLPTGPKTIKNIIYNTVKQYGNKKPAVTDLDVAYFESVTRRGNPKINEQDMYSRARKEYEDAYFEWDNKGRVGPEPNKQEFIETIRSQMTEAIRKEQVNQGLNGVIPPKNQPNGNTNANPGQGVGSAISNFIGASLAGAGFGAGITAFHGIENAMRDEKKPHQYKKRDKLFDASGSQWNTWTGQKNDRPFQQRGDKMPRRMITKEASVFRHMYDNIAGVAENTPKAVASGLGFTGVSLGTAALLKNHPELLRGTPAAGVAPGTTTNSNGEPQNPRIIIELGPDQQAAQSLSRLAHEADQHLRKQANLKTYWNSLMGHPTEMRMLNQRISGDVGSYHDDAAEMLRNQNVQAMAKEKYGNLFETNEKEFAKNLFESKANELKRQDIAQREMLKDQIAKARLLTAGGVGATGLATAAYANRNKGENPNG